MENHDRTSRSRSRDSSSGFPPKTYDSIPVIEAVNSLGETFETYQMPIAGCGDDDADRDRKRDCAVSDVSDDCSSSDGSTGSAPSAWFPGWRDSDGEDEEIERDGVADEEKGGRFGGGQRRMEPENVTPFYFRVLGFEKDPLADSPDLRLSMLSNLSASFNVVNISIALAIMFSPGSPHLETADTTSQSLCSSALIAGMIVGQLVGGAVGDAIGRHVAITLVMILQIISSFGSALSFSISGFSIFHVLALWRFLLGVGCGGVYPLAATLTAESTGTKEERGKLVALTFSMQGVGYIFSPILGYVLVKVFGESSDLSWRILLGVGCIPGVLLMTMRLRRRKKIMQRIQGETLPALVRGSGVLVTNIPPIPNNKQQSIVNETTISEAAHVSDQKPPKVSILTAIQHEKELKRKLLGTAGTWFLFDVMFYGNTLFKRVVLTAAFGDNEDVIAVCRDGFVVTAIALPGYFISVALVGSRQSPRRVQLQGFFLMGIMYFIIGSQFEYLAQYKGLLLSIYGSTFLFSNYGPNSTTFMLPSMTFSPNCRSTLNGISAASGKAGALIGASFFEPLSKMLGDPMIMILCSALSAVGLILTWFCVPDELGLGRREDVLQRKGVLPEERDAPLGEKAALIEVAGIEEGVAFAPTAHKATLGRKRTKTKLPSRFSSPSLLDFVQDD